jgi:hypothetical protein
MSRIARVTLSLMLFTQASVIAHACALPSTQPAAAFDENVPAPCHKKGQFNANACLKDCTQAGQTAGAHEHFSVPAATHAVLSVAFMEVRTPSQKLIAVRLIASGPPQTILYSRFLN